MKPIHIAIASTTDLLSFGVQLRKVTLDRV